jgi:ATP phosphoribosyltransferase
VIRIAVPKGRLLAHSRRFLEQLGADLTGSSRRYTVRHPELDLEAVLLKIPDIPGVLDVGLVDFAIASDEWLFEADSKYESLVALCWYHVRVCVMAPAGDAADLSAAAARRHAKLTVATPYPGLTRRLLGHDAVDIFPVSGSAEAFPGRFCDLAVDCVESEETARCNDLAVVRDLLSCDVRLVARPGADQLEPAALRIVGAALACAVRPACTFASTATAERHLA